MTTQIYHSSFGRYSLMRRRANKGKDGRCVNCGSPSKWQYAYEDDARDRNNWQEHSFCSVSCMRSYHNIEETP